MKQKVTKSSYSDEHTANYAILVFSNHNKQNSDSNLVVLLPFIKHRDGKSFLNYVNHTDASKAATITGLRLS